MPLVQVRVIEGVFSAEEKQEMIKRITETTVSIEGEPLREFSYVLVEEIKGDDANLGDPWEASSAGWATNDDWCGGLTAAPIVRGGGNHHRRRAVPCHQ